MDRGEFLRRLRPMVGIPNTWEADRAAESVLANLADALPADEAHDLASQLPKEYKELVMGRLGQRGPTQAMTWGALIGRVRSNLGLETPEAAEWVTRGVFSALKDAVSPGEMEDVAAELPLDLRETLRRA